MFLFAGWLCRSKGTDLMRAKGRLLGYPCVSMWFKGNTPPPFLSGTLFTACFASPLTTSHRFGDVAFSLWRWRTRTTVLCIMLDVGFGRGLGLSVGCPGAASIDGDACRNEGLPKERLIISC